MSLGYDPEVPAGYQDADIEQARYEAESARAAADRAAGVCHHGALAEYSAAPSYPEQEGLVYGQARCMDCGAVVEMDRCIEPGCSRVARNRGYCRTHWAAVYDRMHRRHR